MVFHSIAITRYNVTKAEQSRAVILWALFRLKHFYKALIEKVEPLSVNLQISENGQVVKDWHVPLLNYEYLGNA